MSYVESREIATLPLSPARKAWETRRRLAAERGEVYRSAPRSSSGPATSRSSSAAAAALAEFDRQAESNNPDWHAAALAMKAALAARAVQIEQRQAPRPAAIETPRLDDHAVPNFRRLQWPAPTIVCVFSGETSSETVRISFSSVIGKPVAIARGLRLAIFAYKVRMARRLYGADQYDQFGRYPRRWKLIDAPAILRCHVELGAGIMRPDIDLVNRETEQLRRASAPEAPLAIGDNREAEL